MNKNIQYFTIFFLMGILKAAELQSSHAPEDSLIVPVLSQAAGDLGRAEASKIDTSAMPTFTVVSAQPTVSDDKAMRARIVAFGIKRKGVERSRYYQDESCCDACVDDTAHCLKNVGGCVQNLVADTLGCLCFPIIYCAVYGSASYGPRRNVNRTVTV